MRNPLPIVALLYAGGLVLGRYLPNLPAWLLGISLGLGVVATAFGAVRGRVLVLMIPVVAWTNLAVRTSVLSPNDLRLTLGTAADYVTVRGTLLESPILRVQERGGRVTQRSSAEIEVQSVRRQTGWAPAFGRVVASTPGVVGAEFHSGLEVEITGVIQTPKGPVAPGQFDYRAYLESRGVFHQLRCENTNDWQIVALLAGPPSRAGSVNRPVRALGAGSVAHGLACRG